MNSNDQFSRLRFLIQVVEREARHLKTTTQRLFAHPIDLSWVESLEQDIDTAERLDAVTLHPMFHLNFSPTANFCVLTFAPN